MRRPIVVECILEGGKTNGAASRQVPHIANAYHHRIKKLLIVRLIVDASFHSFVFVAVTRVAQLVLVPAGGRSVIQEA